MPARHAIACCRLGGWGLHAGWKASRAHIKQSVRDRIVPACSLGHSMRLGTHGPQTHGPQTHGPQTQGPQTHGSQMHGPQMHGPQMHGPQVHGPQVHGPQMHGPEIDEPRQIAQDR